MDGSQKFFEDPTNGIPMIYFSSTQFKVPPARQQNRSDNLSESNLLLKSLSQVPLHPRKCVIKLSPYVNRSFQSTAHFRI